MALDDKIEQIKKISGTLENTEDVAKERFAKVTPNKEHFDDLMSPEQQQAKRVDVTDATKAGKTPTPMEAAESTQRRIEQIKRPEMSDLVVQAEQAVHKIDSVKKQLSAGDVDIRGGAQNVLRNKLVHIDENLKIALAKVGADYVPVQKTEGLTSPVQKFLGYLTHGQAQLETLSSTIEGLQNSQSNLSPASLLALQLKMSFITQEIEFFASLLNKSLESTKTIMNVQV